MDEEAYCRFVSACTYVSNDIPLWIYAGLGIGGEAGEVVDEIKKSVREVGGGVIPEKRLQNLKLELGDLVFYITMLCKVLDIRIEDVRSENVNKLVDRFKKQKPKMYAKLVKEGIILENGAIV